MPSFLSRCVVVASFVDDLSFFLSLKASVFFYFFFFFVSGISSTQQHNIKEKLLEQRHNNNNAHKHSARFKAARGEKRASETRVLLVKVAHTTP
jgi:hypothetical protein